MGGEVGKATTHTSKHIPKMRIEEANACSWVKRSVQQAG